MAFTWCPKVKRKIEVPLIVNRQIEKGSSVNICRYKKVNRQIKKGPSANIDSGFSKGKIPLEEGFGTFDLEVNSHTL